MAKALPADVAAEGPHAAVDPLVVLQVDNVSEGFGALPALERFLPGVDELVSFQRDGAGEAFPAHITDKQLLTGVCVCVAVQVLQQVKAAAAHFAAVRLFPGVDDGVRFELCLFGETLPALWTLVGTLARVRAHVALHALPLAKSSATLAAGERLLPSVDTIVRLQVALGREGFPACRAHEVLPGDALQDELRGAGDFGRLLLELKRNRLHCFNSSSCRDRKHNMVNRHLEGEQQVSEGPP